MGNIALELDKTMSEEDRQRWNERFAQGAYSERTHPSPLLARWLPDADGGRALDVAAGAGRNSVFLARSGFAVTALDIATEGLARARLAAEQAGQNISTIEHDLDDGLPAGLPPFDLIVVIRYLNFSLMDALIAQLAPGGTLIAEVLFEGGGVGPAQRRFRAGPGALSAACGALVMRHSFEGAVEDPDGRSASVAQFVGQRVI